MNDATYHHGEVTHPVCGGTDIYFPVETRPAEVDGRVPGYLAVLRSDTGQVFGFHRAEYRLVRNAELFPQFDQALGECGFDLDGIMVNDAIAYGGARTIRSYRLPKERVEVGVGDPVEFELRVLNSYDSSVAFSAFSAARRLVCLNGMTIGSSFKLYGRHTKGFGVGDLVGKLKAALALYRQGTEQFMRWGYRRIADEGAKEVFQEMPHMNETLLKKLLGYWASEQQSQGNTLWALYNAATTGPRMRACERRRETTSPPSYWSAKRVWPAWSKVLNSSALPPEWVMPQRWLDSTLPLHWRGLLLAHGSCALRED